MTNKRLLILTTIVLAAAVGVWVGPQFYDWHYRLVRSRLIDREHFDLIEKGMRQEEVEAILGGLPGYFNADSFEHIIWTGPGHWENWLGDQGLISVLFDENGAVQENYFAGGGHLPSLFEQAKDWLGPSRSGRADYFVEYKRSRPPR